MKKIKNLLDCLKSSKVCLYIHTYIHTIVFSKMEGGAVI